MTAPASRRKGKSAAETGPEAHDLATRPKDFLTKGEVRALLAAAKDGRHGARDHLLLTMIFQHALRAIEACRLRVDQVDLEAARVWALLREWGRIGSAGRLVSSQFASEEEAALAMAEHLKAKLSKGYEAV